MCTIRKRDKQASDGFSVPRTCLTGKWTPMKPRSHLIIGGKKRVHSGENDDDHMSRVHTLYDATVGGFCDKGSECEDMMMNSPDRCGGSISSDGGDSSIKTCVDCGTSKTPLWRGGPAGPKSLCNACGIRSRKRRRALLGVSKEDKKPKKITATTSGDSQSSGLTTTSKSDYMGDLCLKKRIMALGTEVVLQRPRSKITKRRKPSVEEQAAYFRSLVQWGILTSASFAHFVFVLVDCRGFNSCGHVLACEIEGSRSGRLLLAFLRLMLL
ncbi:GATA transcription factor 16-like protein [Tanacetum coccineum]